MDVTQIVSLSLLILCVIFVPYFIGTSIILAFKINFSKSMAYITGLIFIYSVNELICLPFMLTQGSYNIALILFTLFIILSTGLAFFYLYKTARLREIFSFPNKISLLSLLTLALIFLMGAVAAAFTRFDGDDAFYIAISTTIKQTGKIFSINPSIGLDGFAFPPNYKFSAFEVLTTFLSTFFSLDSVVICHTVFPMIVLPISFVAFKLLAENLFKEEKQQQLFLLFMAVLTLFDGYSNYLPSSFTLLRAWMGKTLTVNICFPYLTVLCIKLYRESKNGRLPWPYFFLIVVCLISGPGTSAVGLYLLPVLYLILFTGYFFFISKKQRGTYLFRSALAALPSALFLLGYYLMLRQNSGIDQLLAFGQTKTWLEIATEYFGYNWYLFLVYLFFCFAFLLTGNTVEKVNFCYTPLLLVLSFLNPLFYPYVGHYLTSFPVYWRFFWLLPAFYTISAGIVKALSSQYKYKNLVYFILIFFMLPGNFALTDNKYYGTENAAKIPDAVVYAVNTIEENVNTDDPQKLYLLALPSYNIYVRQFTGQIAMVMPRVNYVEEAFLLAGKEKEADTIKNLFVYDKNKNIDGFVDKFDLSTLKKLGITLIISPARRAELLGSYREIILENKDYLYIDQTVFKEED